MAICPKCYHRLPLMKVLFSRGELLCPMCNARLVREPLGLVRLFVILLLSIATVGGGIWCVYTREAGIMIYAVAATLLLVWHRFLGAMVLLRQID